MQLDLSQDTYYSGDYISLYLKKGEELFVFKYKEGDKLFINKAIKRPIINIGKEKIIDRYFDLETAYGYGGYYVNNNDTSFLERALSDYKRRCESENIIAEFIRFHPFNNFPQINDKYLNFNFNDRKVVIVDLSQDIFKSYKAKVRNTVKRATEKVEIRESENIDLFIELYNKTMDKNNATDFYFFDKELYISLKKLDDVELYEVIFENEIIAMGFFMFGKDIAHYHLSANSDLSYKLNSNYALLNYMFNIAKEKGLNYFLLGGGTTSDIDDTLLKYKQKFSPLTKSFFISGNIFNKEIYDKYILIWESQTNKNIKYFLKYRLDI